MNDIENLLRRSIGLDAATIGPSVVEHTVRSRMRRLGLHRHEDYLKLLGKSPAEWNNFIETMVVNETWFFREKQPFSAMVRLVVEEWLPAHPTGVLRLLSVPCSTGEEPYSMAMALLDAGLPSGRFHIDAVDISARALAFAQRGAYGRNSFRSEDLDFRTRHFRPAHGGYMLNSAVRSQVRFWRGNILDENCVEGGGSYDIIFCRNLLIYFDRPTQDQTLSKLRHLLTPDGALFTGSAELPLALAHGFTAIDLTGSFACRKTRVSGSALTGRPFPAPVSAKQMPAHPVRRAPTFIEDADSADIDACVFSQRPSSALDKAGQLASEGRLAEAAELCEIHLRQFGVSAEAFYLLGLVRDAAGADNQAGEYYRKALYLEPSHYEALRHWAKLSERNGKIEHARILRERAERNHPDKTPDSWMQ